MNNNGLNGFSEGQYETPFADAGFAREEPLQRRPIYDNFSTALTEPESPFLKTYEIVETAAAQHPLAGEFVQFLGELNDAEFTENLYELAAELEDTWSAKISNEIAMGERFIPFANQQATEYFRPLIRASENMIDTVANHFSGNNFAEHSAEEVESFFNEMEFDHAGFSPAQEQFFGSLWKKVKSVAKKGLDLAKRGISVAGKFLPLNFLLNRLKALIRPLMEKVLESVIGKLPANLQPYAQTLAKKFLNLEASFEAASETDEVPTSGQLEAIQTELDNHIASLVFSTDEDAAGNFAMEYESSSDYVERSNHYESGGLNLPSLNNGRQQLINELKDLQAGENPAPAIERFLPVALQALRPLIKPVLTLLGRQKVINFLAGLLAKLIGKYVPENVAKPLSEKIIDLGMNAIGFETYEMNKSDVAYEALVNTIQETIQNIGELNEETLNDNEALTMNLLEAFETAAANNFPFQYIREELRTSSRPGVWVLKPRNAARHMYKKYTEIFNVVIEPQTAKSVIVFRGLPLSNFLRDKLGLDPSKPIKARVHLFEAIADTKLSQIGKNENVPGLGTSQPHSWVQLQPLSKQAAALLLHEPGLGKNVAPEFTKKRIHISTGQRFYYLEINGARLRVTHTAVHDYRHGTGQVTVHDHRKPQGSGTVQNYRQPTAALPVSSKPAHSGDIRGVINFVKSEIKFCYYFSEEEAKSIVEKLNLNDFLSAASIVRYAVRDVLNGLLLHDVTDKIKIIHESFPEMFLENYTDQESSAGLRSGKQTLTALITNLTEKLSGLAYHAIRDFFKTRAAEFKQAQAQPQDGVTIKIMWASITGMAAIKTFFTAVRGNLPAKFEKIYLPNLPKPELQVKAGKHMNH